MTEGNASPSPSSPRKEASGPALQLDLNGEAHRVPAPCSVADLLGGLELTGKRVAVAVNRQVVARSRYAEFNLSEGDRIEILEAVGGG